jgi:signal transduction histidine kinase
MLFGLVSCTSLKADYVMANPIGRVARIFNPKLVKMEDRVAFLNRQLISLAAHQEHSLKFGIGCRGAQLEPSDPLPSMTVDLGKEYPIELLFLVPLHADAGDEIFPKNFKIEFSVSPDFSDRRVLYDTGNSYFPETGGKPVKFSGQGAVARYVRITVSQGQIRGRSEVFGLAELVVISGGFPVSFGCEVSSVGALRVKDLWYPEALTDGRMPLGIWQGGNLSNDSGSIEEFEAGSTEERIVWSIDFEKARKLDLLMLFPLVIHSTLEASIMPEKIDVQVLAEGESEFRTISTWEYPFKGLSHEVPLIRDLGGVKASAIRIIGLEASMVGAKSIFGLSEIQVWSDQQNISNGMPVERDFSGNVAEVGYLTDGFASQWQIIPVGAWLNQLYDRWRAESEIEALRPMHTQMAAESELNATWGSAMMLGLTFLIPVFIVERRRLISRNQIDQLRKRIASDLHDDIGSNLGSISLIARTARKDLVRLHGPEEVGEDLGEVESIARESSLAMRDIVWLLERKQDSIGDLVHRMRETATRLLREVDYTIECDSGKSAAKLSLDAKRHLFLFYKEAVHNIIKHSGATVVSIRLWDEGDKLALEVIDNGRGLPKIVVDGKEVTKPVRKLDERARVLEGSLEMRSEPGKGTRVLLIVKRSLLTAAPTIK